MGYEIAGVIELYNQAHFKGNIAINARGPSVLIIAILL